MQESESATARVLRLVRMDKEMEENGGALHVGEHADGDEGDDGHSEDELLHVDERWLVSYADMMTLLFGLFVLLYSTVNKFDQVRQEAIKVFGDKAGGTVASIASTALASQAEVKKAMANAEERIKTQAATIASNTQEVTRLTTELNALKSEALADQSLKSAPRKIALLNRQLRQIEQDRDVARKELVSLQAVLAQNQQALAAEMAKSAGKKSFVTVMIRWPTTNHDIDLTIEDPSGKIFGFKNRKYPDHPGEFVLDTRRGPGAEIWQSDQVISGTYKVKYHFYNQYGNTNPTVVTGTIFTSHGSLSIPDVSMDFTGNRSATFSFSVDKEGQAVLVR
ncbi:flagellar motor protein MotB [Bdellovibrionota bacterium FG-1]